jgi:hypothetical protein
MHRRRDRLHHAQALKLALALGAACLAAAPARADVQKVTADGSVHRVDVDVYTSAKGTGTGIRYTRQKPAGGRETSWVPGTDDVAIDQDAVLDVEPSSGRPVLVWSRNEGTGFDLYIARLENGAWTAPRLLMHGAGDDTLPQMRYDDRYLHVAWRQLDPSGSVSLYRSSFDPTSWAPIYGPERIPIDDVAPVPPSGSSTTGPAVPSMSFTYFCGAVPGALPGDPGRMVAWGVRDEPLPIGYHQIFSLPQDVTTVTSAEAGYIGGRFTLWFVSGAKAYYTVLTSTGWSSLRLIELNAQTSAADARAQIHSLNKRGGPQ